MNNNVIYLLFIYRHHAAEQISLKNGCQVITCKQATLQL